MSRPRLCNCCMTGEIEALSGSFPEGNAPLAGRGYKKGACPDLRSGLTPAGGSESLPAPLGRSGPP